MNPIDLVKSLVDFNFYKEVPKRSFGQASAYIGLLATVFAACLVAAMSVQIVPKLRQHLEWARDSFPEMRLENGRLASAAEKPVVVRHPDAPKLTIVIDASREAEVSLEELRENRTVAYLTSNAIYLAKLRPILEARHEESVPGFAIDGIDMHPLERLKTDEPLVLDKDFYDRISGQLPFLLYPTGFAVGWLLFFAWKHGAALVYSLIALLMNGFQSGKLEYPALFKIAVWAQTPVVLLQIAALFLPEPIRLFGLITLIVVGVYLWKAIAVVNADLPEPPSPLES
jgi:hypothetical protein